jgi:transposase
MHRRKSAPEGLQRYLVNKIADDDRAGLTRAAKRTATESLATTARNRRLSNDESMLTAHLERVRELRGKPVLSRNESLMVVHTYLTLCLDGKLYQKKKGQYKATGAESETARILGISRSTVGIVMRDWKANYDTVNPVRVAGVRGNYEKKQCRVPDTTKTMRLVHDFVRYKRRNPERVNSTQVTEYLVEVGILSVKTCAEGSLKGFASTLHFDKNDYEAAGRATRAFLTRNGFRRGKRTDRVSVNPEHIAWRNRYVRKLLQNRAKDASERLREVYLDESYIHQHYNRLEDSLWDPNDEQDLSYRAPAKGRRYCFAAAIQGPSARATAESSLQKDKAGLVRGSFWAFCPQRADEHTGDYHKVFNSENFLNWWKEQLLPSLGEPRMIIIDNASYHKTKPAGTPVPGKMRRNELLEECSKCGLQIDSDATSIELRQALKKRIEETVEPESVQLARAAGHEVLFTPPHYSDLYPIELVWALVKGNVGRQYSATTSLQDVYTRLTAEFDELGSDTGQFRDDSKTRV